MRHYLVIGLLFSCALAASDLPAQTGPDRHPNHDIGPPPLLLVYDGSDTDFQPKIFTIEASPYPILDSVDQRPVADTTTNKHQPQAVSIHAHQPAQDDHPLRPRSTVGNQPKYSLPERLPALHLSQAWSIPHRPGQLHRTIHY